MHKYITSELKQNVLTIKLNRPEKFNSFNRAMALELISELESAKNNKDTRCIVLTGEGKAFCAGQDLSEAIDPSGVGIERIIKEHYNPIVLAIREIEKPVIAAVNGVAAGAGANIALACDIVFMAKSASFIQAFSKIGLIPDSGGTYTLPRAIGFNLASALMITGDKVTAEEAHHYGLAYKVFDDNSLLEQALVNARHIATLPTKAIGLTKRLLNKSANNSLEQQLILECNTQIEAANTYDHKEGVNAFLEKRHPNFKGE
ncbi:MAG: enoyl-CoA hydratase/isomerase family protein [Bacteroidetes bacterium]|nr:enoyl-CoA hydratase/isomerase family protein [Bacteroidota bacterium]